jgi:hypothetical protein
VWSVSSFMFPRRSVAKAKWRQATESLVLVWRNDSIEAPMPLENCPAVGFCRADVILVLVLVLSTLQLILAALSYLI